MPDHPIAPDLTGDVPRCVVSCPSRERTLVDRYGHCTDPAQPRHGVIGDICIPRVRELVAISRRRCDGCRDWNDGLCANGMYRERRKPGESCSRWEAKRDG